MIAELSPALILVLGGLVLPFVPRPARGGVMLVLPVIALMQLLSLPFGALGKVQLMGLELTTLRIDKLSFVFALIFLIAAGLAVIYALHVKDLVQQVAALVYAGTAVGAVLAGDLVTLFICWEGTAVSSVFLVWASRTESSYRAGMRYLIVQVGSGVLLLAGVMLHYRATGSIAFEALGLDGSLGKQLIFLAFGIKCAFPLLHNWLQDAYPEATVTGTVILSSFTTKLAVYSLARGYAGTEMLVTIGAVMTAFPIFYAVIENDLRRVLAYSLNNQLGFMVVGIGIGTELALNGAAAHAFCHILYKSLLFMSMGAVLLRVGTTKGSELGGLFKSMPWTTGFCIVGAASISAFPLFSGFVSKGMIIAAAMDGGYFWTWMVLLFASAGVFHHSGIKIPFFAFFAHDSGKRCAEAPTNMLVAMAITAALCIGIGVYPQPLYAILPFQVSFVPYTLDHVVSQLQLLMFSALAFTVLMRTGVYPPELRSTNLDTDWLWRKPGKSALLAIDAGMKQGWRRIEGMALHIARAARHFTHSHHGPDGVLGRPWPTGTMALWATLMLGAYLVLAYL
jgi:multicomponent Na+:H+ antiporter subunit D